MPNGDYESPAFNILLIRIPFSYPISAHLQSNTNLKLYSLLAEFPGASHVASAHLTRLTNLLSKASKGHYNKDTAIHFREAAKHSIDSVIPAKSLELKHTIKLILELITEIEEIETAIKRIMDEEIRSPILIIPSISCRMGAMIIAEIEDFNRFSSPDKMLLYLPGYVRY